MQILDSIIEGALAMPDRSEGDALIVAVVRFLASGEVPEGLTGYAQASWAMIEPVLVNSRQKAENGRRGGRPRATVSKSKRESKPKSKTESKPKSCEGGFASLSSSSSYSLSQEGVQGEETEGPEPPTREEVRDYFGANCLKGDPDAFFDFYESQGWLKSNGLPISSWTSQANQWHRRQAQIDSERAARGEPTEAEAKWRPAAEEDPQTAYERAQAEYEEALAKLTPEERRRFNLG